MDYQTKLRKGQRNPTKNLRKDVNYLVYYFIYLKKNYKKKSLNEKFFEEEDFYVSMKEYLQSIHKKKLEVASKKFYIRKIEVFLNWCLNKNPKIKNSRIACENIKKILLKIQKHLKFLANNKNSFFVDSDDENNESNENDDQNDSENQKISPKKREKSKPENSSKTKQNKKKLFEEEKKEKKFEKKNLKKKKTKLKSEKESDESDQEEEESDEIDENSNEIGTIIKLFLKQNSSSKINEYKSTLRNYFSHFKNQGVVDINEEFFLSEKFFLCNDSYIQYLLKDNIFCDNKKKDIDIVISFLKFLVKRIQKKYQKNDSNDAKDQIVDNDENVYVLSRVINYCQEYSSRVFSFKKFNKEKTIKKEKKKDSESDDRDSSSDSEENGRKIIKSEYFSSSSSKKRIKKEKTKKNKKKIKKENRASSPNYFNPILSPNMTNPIKNIDLQGVNVYQLENNNNPQPNIPFISLDPMFYNPAYQNVDRNTYFMPYSSPGMMYHPFFQQQQNYSNDNKNFENINNSEGNNNNLNNFNNSNPFTTPPKNSPSIPPSNLPSPPIPPVPFPYYPPFFNYHSMAYQNNPFGGYFQSPHLSPFPTPFPTPVTNPFNPFPSPFPTPPSHSPLIPPVYYPTVNIKKEPSFGENNVSLKIEFVV